MSGSQAQLTIERFSVLYDAQPAVDAVDLTVPAGQITALLGPNGAGKSSLVQAIGGVAGTYEGRLTVDGREVPLGRPDLVRRAGVAVLPEGHRVLGDLTVQDNLRVATCVLPRAERPAAVAELLGVFPELERLRGRPAGLLSGGEQQMLALIQALVSKPRYVVVDELSLGLAPTVVRRLAGHLRSLSDRGLGILLIEQFTSLALDLASRVYVLARGRITPPIDPQLLIDEPDRLHEAYLARPQLEVTHPGRVVAPGHGRVPVAHDNPHP